MQRSQWRQKTSHSSGPQHDTRSFGLYLLLQQQEMQKRSQVAAPRRSDENSAPRHTMYLSHTLLTSMCPPSDPSNNWTATSSCATRCLTTSWTESWEQDRSPKRSNRNQIQLNQFNWIHWIFSKTPKLTREEHLKDKYLLLVPMQTSSLGGFSSISPIKNKPRLKSY